MIGPHDFTPQSDAFDPKAVVVVYDMLDRRRKEESYKLW